MAQNPITIGELANVPAVGSRVKSDWAQDATNRIAHRFATNVERDTWAAGNGSLAYTVDRSRLWLRIGGVWQLIGGKLPAVTATKVTPQAAGNNAQTIVTWPDAELVDTDGMHDLVTNSERLTVPAGLGGMWLASYTMYAGLIGSAGRIQGFMTVNTGGTRFGWAGASTVATDDAVVTGSQVIALAAGDYVRVQIYQANNGATTRNVGVAGLPMLFSANYLGPSPT